MTTSSDITPEVDEVLTRLSRVVRRASEFVLGFVKCNSPIQQREMSRLLSERLSEKRSIEITLDEPIISLLDKLKVAVDVTDPPAFVNVFGLEKSIYAQEDYSPVLGRLNNDRDLIRRACPAVLLIWLPDFALDKMVLSAPDFWAWRSGVYEFPIEAVFWQAATDSVLHMPSGVLFSMVSQEKVQEIAHLQNLIHVAQNLETQNKREQQILARLFYQVGVLLTDMGNYEGARRNLQQSLELAQSSDNPEQTYKVLRRIGFIEEDTGNFDTAKQLYEQSLQIAQRIGDKYGVARAMQQLGLLRQSRGDLESALGYYQQSLQTVQEVGDTRNLCASLYHMGMVERLLGNFDTAKQLYEQSLQIAQRIGDKYGVARAMQQLGLLRQSRGDLESALGYYQQALHLIEELGICRDWITTHLAIGNIEQTQGRLREAMRHYMQVLAQITELPGIRRLDIVKALRSICEDAGEEQFHTWLQDDFPKQYKTVLRILKNPESL